MAGPPQAPIPTEARITSWSRSASIHFGEQVNEFLRAASAHGVRMLLIGGGAVTFHGYQRQSAVIDFWMEPTMDNFTRLTAALRSIGYAIDRFPDRVLSADQNITLKMSPGVDVEVVTFLRPGFTFDEAWARAHVQELGGEPSATCRVLAFDDLVMSKLRAARPKDLLDVHELQRRRAKAESTSLAGHSS